MKIGQWICRDCLIPPFQIFDTYEEALKHVAKTGHGIWKKEKKEIEK